MACAGDSFVYNGSLCACPPGQIYNRTGGGCWSFWERSLIVTDSGVDYYALSFPETIFAFDSIKKFSQSQAVFLEATLVMLLSWLAMCLLLRFTRLGDGRNIWFQLRWWISRLDICFATRHWLDDQKVVIKRKTELGGTFSIASWILFIGLFAALLYQIISKRTIEVHNVRATNAPDLASFINDMEFNITAISSMSCSNLRGLDNVVTGNPSFIDFRVSPLSSFVNFSCHNTSIGPTISLKCTSCRILHDYMYISWNFVDLQNIPAAAVGFLFNFTANDHARKNHVSFVSGTLKNGSTFDDSPVTFRGMDVNVLKFNLFPRLYHNLNDLRLLQPLFHEFVPGSFFREATPLRASLERSADGLINTTLSINFLSAYIVEIEKRSIMGPVSFLADLGGLYCISVGIFFYLLVQCEYRIKKLRKEDSVLQKIRSRRKAQEHWDKLRKYVMYTWGCNTLDDDHINTKNGSTCSNIMSSSFCASGSVHKSASSRKRRQQSRMDTISLNKKTSLSSEKNAVQEPTYVLEVEFGKAGTASGPHGRLSRPVGESLLKQERGDSANNEKKHSPGSRAADTPKPRGIALADDDIVPPPPPLVFKVNSEVEMSDIQKNFLLLYEYNVMLRERLVETQSSLKALAANKSSSSSPAETET